MRDQGLNVRCAVFFGLFVTGVATGLAAEQASNNSTDERPLNVTWNDDFSQDITGRYNVSPPAKFEHRELHFGNGGRIAHQIGMGQVAELTVEWEQQPKHKVETCEFRFGLLGLTGAGGMAAIRIDSEGNQSKAIAQIMRIDVDGQGHHSEQVVRQFPLVEASQNGAWKLRYQYGVIDLFHGNQRVASGDVGKDGLSLNAFFFEQAVGDGTCRNFQLSAADPPPPRSRQELQSLQAGFAKFSTLQPQAFELLRKEQYAQALSSTFALFRVLKTGLRK